MKITYSRVDWFDVRNLLGFDLPEETIRAYEEHIQNSSVIWLGKLDGIDAAACGLITTSLFSETAYIWVLDSPISRRHTVYLILWSSIVLREALEHYKNIIGWCRCDNEAAQKWMKWLGAEFDSTPRRVPKIEGYHYSFRITRP